MLFWEATMGKSIGDAPSQAFEEELLAMAVERLSNLEWEELIASGGGPGLALGAERRLRREPPGP
jgi:hypothetical protein